MSKIRVLFVDDEDDFRTPIAAILSRNDIEIMEADSPSQMDEVLSHYTPDIVILDVNLPEESGFEIARRLKQGSDYSIIILTAYGAVEDRIEGLSQGADYYLPKPVDTRELIAVIQSLYQRRQDKTSNSPKWTLNITTWTLTTPDQAQHELTKSEIQILAELATRHSKPVSRRQLYSALGLHDYAPESRSLDIQISRLRRRFTTEDYTIPIKTIHSIGYLFTENILVQN